MNYPIGTVCIGQNFVICPHRNELECEVIAGLAERNWVVHGTGEIGRSFCYIVRWADGFESHQEPYTLRRKPPKHKEWADEAVRKLKKQSSDHVAVQLADAIPEETA